MKFSYQPIFEKSSDPTIYRKLSDLGVRTERWGSEDFLRVDFQTLAALTEVAMDDVSHLLRSSHLEKLAKILQDPEASSNDRFVALDLLRNAVIAAERVFPSCQDTGTAIVIGKKGDHVLTSASAESLLRSDKEALSFGIFETFRKRNLRYSQMAPLSMFEEKNTGTNLPAQIDLYSEPGMEYQLLYLAKGGGSANKSFLYQKTKAVLSPSAMEAFLREAIAKLGTAACPPYHLAIVVGGTSAEDNLKTVKLASAGELDGLPTQGNLGGRAYRDLEMEASVEKWSQETKIGAQFGGKYLVHDVRVIRMPRHGASCPVGIGVSCSADRNIKAKISKDGVFIEQLEENPARFLPAHVQKAQTQPVSIDLRRPMAETLAELRTLSVATQVRLNGPLVVARDVAHAKLVERLKQTGTVPDYFKQFGVYYAGPAKTPEGHASGSFGPTTSERMDPYVPLFQAAGASLLMLGKGNRSREVTESCHKFGGFYLGSIGGPAARLGKECISKVEVLEYAELGMEAVWKIEVQDFPAFIIVDHQGNDFFQTVVRYK